jgi:deferrochelatase/peroxidase EfeB
MSQPTPERPESGDSPGAGVSRRRLLGLAGAGAALAGVGAVGGVAGQRLLDSNSSGATVAVGPGDAVAFYGKHQAGIVTPAQDRMHFVALDVRTDSRDELVALLREWTHASSRMSVGAEATPGGATGGVPEAPPSDTGEALDLAASALTITVGFGGSLFDDRFGLAGSRPPALADLPGFLGDDLDPARCGGDIAIQACANDPQVAVHAVRNLIRMSGGAVSVRWSQLGFGRTSSTSITQTTPRNLFGFKDGTRNLKAEDPELINDHVWVSSEDGPDWMVGGSYLVARRIRMHVEVWDRTSLIEQETLIGRRKGSGAAIGAVDEFARVDFDATNPDGTPTIDVAAHIRLAAPESLDGVRILRRGYNFTDGTDGLGHLDAGLFFIAFVRDAHRQFVPMQQALAARDEMMEYIEHTGSALFACPPGVVADGGFWGEQLFA